MIQLRKLENSFLFPSNEYYFDYSIIFQLELKRTVNTLQINTFQKIQFFIMAKTVYTNSKRSRKRDPEPSSSSTSSSESSSSSDSETSTTSSSSSSRSRSPKRRRKHNKSKSRKAKSTSSRSRNRRSKQRSSKRHSRSPVKKRTKSLCTQRKRSRSKTPERQQEEPKRFNPAVQSAQAKAARLESLKSDKTLDVAKLSSLLDLSKDEILTIKVSNWKRKFEYISGLHQHCSKTIRDRDSTIMCLSQTVKEQSDKIKQLEHQTEKLKKSNTMQRRIIQDQNDKISNSVAERLSSIETSTPKKQVPKPTTILKKGPSDKAVSFVMSDSKLTTTTLKDIKRGNYKNFSITAFTLRDAPEKSTEAKIFTISDDENTDKAPTPKPRRNIVDYSEGSISPEPANAIAFTSGRGFYGKNEKELTKKIEDFTQASPVKSGTERVSDWSDKPGWKSKLSIDTREANSLLRSTIDEPISPAMSPKN